MYGRDLFPDTVAPIFQHRCLHCHDDVRQEGGLSLQNVENVLQAGLIDASDPDLSRLLQVITPEGGKAEMPKDAEPLSAQEQEAVRRWIAAGALWPDGLRLEHPVVDDFQWWSFQPINRPAVPAANELAAKMQLSAPEALDLSGEPAHVMKLYGLDRVGATYPDEINVAEEAEYLGRKCLIARRLLERGVRFVQIWSGNDNSFPRRNWDIHATILHLMGIDHKRLTVRHDGIDRRLTDVHGHVIREIIA